MAVQTQIQTRRGTAASWTSTNPTLAAGEIGFESDTGKIKIGTGSTAWNALAYTASSTAVTYLFNATAAQTTFSGTDANGLTLAYTVGSEQVYLNGVLQVRGSDYTATNGTSIVLTSGALVSDVLNVIAFSALALADTYTQAQADARFVQQSNNFFAGKNKIINGDFGVWQRGTSFSNPANGSYLSDRWTFNFYVAQPTTYSFTQQTFTPGTAPVAGYEGQYFFRSTVTTLGSASSDYDIMQKIENVQTFAGQTITLSFWAKTDSARTISAYIIQNFGSGGSGEVVSSVSTFSGTTSWTRFSTTFSVPSIAGKTIGAGSFLRITIRQTAANGSVLDLWGVQVEAGSIATPFQTATGTIQGELAACQRYFLSVAASAQGFATSTTAALLYYFYPVLMRTNPSVTAPASLTDAIREVATAFRTPTAISANNQSGSIQFNATGMTGLTQFNRVDLNVTYQLSAEL
jgi:hypothetical protein